MRFFLITSLFLLLLPLCLAAGDKYAVQIPVAGNLSLTMQNVNMHQTPLVDFFRRYERVIRQAGKFNNTPESKPLILQLNLEQPPGTCRFVYSQPLQAKVLQIAPDLENLLRSPQVGRRITMALLQSRMGNDPELALPAAAWWIADGLWAEFVQRENLNFPILNFTWLPELRRLAEQGFRMKLDLDTLTPPSVLKVHMPSFVLYTQRAQLMVEIAGSTASGRHGNLLKDYCFLLDGRRLPPAECFGMVFAQSARKKLNIPEAENAAAMPPAQRFAPGYEALEKLALRTLFSGYAPMNPEALLVRFNLINQLEYQPDKSPNVLKAELADLPLILARHANCAPIREQKVKELNEFSLLTPLQLRSDIIKLAVILSEVGKHPREQSTRQLKQQISAIRRELALLQQIDLQLQKFERAAEPEFYLLRYHIGDHLPPKPLTGRIKQFLDRQDRQQAEQ